MDQIVVVDWLSTLFYTTFQCVGLLFLIGIANTYFSSVLARYQVLFSQGMRRLDTPHRSSLLMIRPIDTRPVKNSSSVMPRVSCSDSLLFSIGLYQRANSHQRWDFRSVARTLCILSHETSFLVSENLKFENNWRKWMKSCHGSLNTLCISCSDSLSISKECSQVRSDTWKNLGYYFPSHAPQ